ncbi:MAG: hypothetical protein HQ592_14890 [Planctomycetes bacterium]|nr:hypothetical protein [Planctomycetota bacterium]
MAKAAKKRPGAWTRDDVKQLKRLYRNMRTADVASKMGRSVGSVQSKATSFGLTKTKKYLKSIGRG